MSEAMQLYHVEAMVLMSQIRIPADVVGGEMLEAFNILC